MNETKIVDRYLLNEMPEQEREQFEESFVDDDDLFYEIVARENELVDRYDNNALNGTELERFELSLATLPARRQKIANAKVLREFIANERGENKAITIAERSGFFTTLGQLFSFKSPAFQFASIGLIAVLALASIYLLSENRRLGSLQQELAESHRREAELTSKIESERETAGDLTADLDAERERIQKLETEIAKSRDRNGNNAPPASVTTVPSTVATLLLSPIGIRGGSTPERRLDLKPGVARVAIIADLPEGVANVERVSVRLNSEIVADKVRVRARPGSKRAASITLSNLQLKDGKNTLDIIDGTGTPLIEYGIFVIRDQ